MSAAVTETSVVTDWLNKAANDAVKTGRDLSDYRISDAGDVLAKVQRFKLLEPQEYATGEHHEPEWLIHELFPCVGLGLRWGASGAGKSFDALDTVFAVTRGVPWRDRAVRKGRGVIVVAEGEHAYPLRVKAYAARHGVALADLPTLLPEPVNLFDVADIESLIAALKPKGVDYLLIDTLAQCSSGAEENSAKDMKVVLGHCNRIAREMRCFVEVIHHAGKGDTSKGARGSSVLRPAVDVELFVEGDGKTGTTTIEKVKDAGGKGTQFAFALEHQQLGVSKRTGKPFGSLVIAWKDSAPKKVSRGVKDKLGKNEKTVLDVAAKHPGGIQYEDMLAEIMGKLPKKARRANYERAAENLFNRDVLVFDRTSETVTLPGPREATAAEFDSAPG